MDHRFCLSSSTVSPGSKCPLSNSQPPWRIYHEKGSHFFLSHPAQTRSTSPLFCSKQLYQHHTSTSCIGSLTHVANLYFAATNLDPGSNSRPTSLPNMRHKFSPTSRQSIYSSTLLSQSGCIGISFRTFCPYARTNCHEIVPSSKRRRPNVRPVLLNTVQLTTRFERYSIQPRLNALRYFKLHTSRRIQSASASKHNCWPPRVLHKLTFT